jgi:hypothetical protein
MLSGFGVGLNGVNILEHLGDRTEHIYITFKGGGKFRAQATGEASRNFSKVWNNF